MPARSYPELSGLTSFFTNRLMGSQVMSRSLSAAIRRIHCDVVQHHGQIGSTQKRTDVAMGSSFGVAGCNDPGGGGIPPFVKSCGRASFRPAAACRRAPWGDAD